MIDVLDAVVVLRDKEVLSDGEMERLRSWFSQLVDWMLTAPNALKIAEGRNNLGVAYDVQLIRYAMFSGRTELARRTLAQFPERAAGRSDRARRTDAAGAEADQGDELFDLQHRAYARCPVRGPRSGRGPL